MKPADLSIPLRDLRAADTVPLEQVRVINRALDETYFHVEMEPGVGGLRGATTVDATTFSFTFEDFPPGAAAVRRRTRRLRDLWPKTTLRFDLWYTANVGSTLNFTVVFSIRQVDTGFLLSAPTIPINVSTTIPGPAVANDILHFTYIAPGLILPASQVCEFSFGRGAPDANPNDLRFILADFWLQEAA